MGDIQAVIIFIKISSGNVLGELFWRLPMGIKYTLFGWSLTEMILGMWQVKFYKDDSGKTYLLKLICHIYHFNYCYLFHWTMLYYIILFICSVFLWVLKYIYFTVLSYFLNQFQVVQVPMVMLRSSLSVKFKNIFLIVTDLIHSFNKLGRKFSLGVENTAYDSMSAIRFWTTPKGDLPQ